MTFQTGKSGNPGGRPKVLVDVQKLARQHVPAAIAELARLAVKAKSETARIAACRELLDRGYGKSRQALDIAPDRGADPIQLLLDDIAAASKVESRYIDQSE